MVRLKTASQEMEKYVNMITSPLGLGLKSYAEEKSRELG